MISCSRSGVFLLDDGDPVFWLDRDGEEAGTFSKHSPEMWEGGGWRKCDKGLEPHIHLTIKITSVVMLVGADPLLIVQVVFTHKIEETMNSHDI